MAIGTPSVGDGAPLVQIGARDGRRDRAFRGELLRGFDQAPAALDDCGIRRAHVFLGPVGDRALALLHYEILQLGALRGAASLAPLFVIDPSGNILQAFGGLSPFGGGGPLVGTSNS